jgi:hypothetical protein
LPTSTSFSFSGSVSVLVSPVVPVTTMPSAPAVDHIVDVLLDVVPVDLTVSREGGYQGDKHLAEWVLGSGHTYEGIAPTPLS